MQGDLKQNVADYTAEVTNDQRGARATSKVAPLPLHALISSAATATRLKK